MGFWSGIKKALNSTVGTANFQSLDKMILGAKGLVESDNLYLDTGISENFTEVMEPGLYKRIYLSPSIKINWGGSILLTFGVYSNQASVSFDRVGVFVEKNNEQIYSSGYLHTNYTDVSLPITVQPGDELKIGYFFSTTSVGIPITFDFSISSAKIYADLIDTSGVSIIR